MTSTLIKFAARGWIAVVAAAVWLTAPTAHAQSQTITTIAGTGVYGNSGNGGAAKSAQLAIPTRVTVDGNGTLYIQDFYGVRQVSANGIISAFNTGGVTPAGLAADRSGNVYFSDVNRQVIYKSTGGTLSLFAGTLGGGGYSGDGGPATAAKLNNPLGLATDRSGNLYVADNLNNVVRRIASDGTIATVAGSAGKSGYSGDGGPATAALLNGPVGVAVDGAGNLFIADAGNLVVRQVKTDGTIRSPGWPITPFNNFTVDANGNGYIAYYSAGYVMLRSLSDNSSTIFAGLLNQPGYTGDGAAANQAQLNLPQGLAFDVSGNLYIADSGNNVVRRIQLAPANNTLTVTLAGTGKGTVTSAPAGLTCTAAGTALARRGDIHSIAASGCQGSFATGTAVTLTASAAAGSVFAGWSGGCTGTAASLALTLSADTACTATFNAATSQVSLAVTPAGAGSGTVISSPAGINCSAANTAGCTSSFAGGSQITLIAAPDSGSSFGGWSGGWPATTCAGSTPTLSVTLTAATTCTATFFKPLATVKRLTVNTTGSTGSGIVTSTPAGVACSTLSADGCSISVTVGGTSITLVASAAPGSSFAGWSGACSGSNSTITVTISDDTACGALFTKPAVAGQTVQPATGWWWGKTEPGRGYALEVRNNSLFLSAYMYTTAGPSVWYAASLTPNSDGTGYSGPLYQYAGGQTLAGTFTGSGSSVQVGGSGAVIKVSFDTPTTGTLVLPAPGAGGSVTSVAISRYEITTGGLAAAANASLPESGWWWNPLEPGRGLFLESQTDSSGAPQLFAAFYMYRADGSAVWYVAQGVAIKGLGTWTVTNAQLQECSNGLALGQAGSKTSSCTDVAGGQVSLTFNADRTTGIWTLPTGTQSNIQRYRF